MPDFIKRIVLEIEDHVQPDEGKAILETVMDKLGLCWAEMTEGPVYDDDGQHVANVSVQKVPMDLQMACLKRAADEDARCYQEAAIAEALQEAIKDGVIGSLKPVQDILKVGHSLFPAGVTPVADEVAARAMAEDNGYVWDKLGDEGQNWWRRRSAAEPAADEVEAVRAGNVVLNGEGTGLYSEAEDAIRLLIVAMQARSAEPRYKPNRGERPETLRDDGKCGMCGGEGRIEVTTYANAPDAGYAPCPMGCPAEPAGEEPVAWMYSDPNGPNKFLDGEAFATAKRWPIGVTEAQGWTETPLYARPATPTNPERLVDGWRPIDSAPKDGSWFLACDAFDGAHYAAAWDGDENWMVRCGQYVTVTPEPTHWMPLPAAPLKGEGE